MLISSPPKYRFSFRDSCGYDSGLSARFREPGRTDFRQTKSLGRTTLESINAKRPSCSSLSSSSSSNSSSSCLARKEEERPVKRERRGTKECACLISLRPLIMLFLNGVEVTRQSRLEQLSKFRPLAGKLFQRVIRFYIEFKK